MKTRDLLPFVMIILLATGCASTKQTDLLRTTSSQHYTEANDNFVILQNVINKILEWQKKFDDHKHQVPLQQHEHPELQEMLDDTIIAHAGLDAKYENHIHNFKTVSDDNLYRLIEPEITKPGQFRDTQIAAEYKKHLNNVRKLAGLSVDPSS